MAWYDSFLIFTKTIYLLLDICWVWAAYFFLKSLVTPALEMASLYILTILLGLIHVFMPLSFSIGLSALIWKPYF